MVIREGAPAPAPNQDSSSDFDRRPSPLPPSPSLTPTPTPTPTPSAKPLSPRDDLRARAVALAADVARLNSEKTAAQRETALEAKRLSDDVSQVLRFIEP